MKNKYLILAILLLQTSLINTVFCQNSATNSGGQVVSVQPKIMVIPYTKEGEDLRIVLENDENKRIAIAKIKEAFDSRGFTTVDFSLGYDYKNFLIQAKVGNIFDVENYNVHENYSVNPITPRNYYFTLTYRL